MSFLEQPTESELHTAYQERHQREQAFQVRPENLRTAGYSEAQIRKIRDELKKARDAV